MSPGAGRILSPDLGGKPPSGLDALTDDELERIAVALRKAKRRQSQELEAAIEQALDIVPRLLRGTIRKMLFG